MEIETDLPATAAERPVWDDWERRLGFSAIYLTHLPRERWAAFQAFAHAVLDLEPSFVGSKHAQRLPGAFGGRRVSAPPVEGFHGRVGLRGHPGGGRRLRG